MGQARILSDMNAYYIGGFKEFYNFPDSINPYYQGIGAIFTIDNTASSIAFNSTLKSDTAYLKATAFYSYSLGVPMTTYTASVETSLVM